VTTRIAVVGLLPRQFHNLERKCPASLVYVDKAKSRRVPRGVDYVLLCTRFIDHGWTQFVHKYFRPDQVVLVGRGEDVLAKATKLTIIGGWKK
jgi:hypothetical protein